MMMVGGFLFFSFFTVFDVAVGISMLVAIVLVVMIITMTGWRGLRNPRYLIMGALAVAALTVLMTISAGNYPWLEKTAPDLHQWLAESNKTLRWVRSFSGGAGRHGAARSGCRAFHHPPADRPALVYGCPDDAGAVWC
jgi:hypothetical protein